jgi:hypothetical protein
MYPLVFELFAAAKRGFVDPLIMEKNPSGRGPKQIRKRYCKKGVDHYNSIPSLNIFDCQKLVLISDPVFDSCEGYLALISILALPG